MRQSFGTWENNRVGLEHTLIEQLLWPSKTMLNILVGKWETQSPLLSGREVILAARQGENKCDAGVKLNRSSKENLKKHNCFLPSWMLPRARISWTPKYCWIMCQKTLCLFVKCLASLTVTNFLGIMFFLKVKQSLLRQNKTGAV